MILVSVGNGIFVETDFIDSDKKQEGLIALFSGEHTVVTDISNIKNELLAQYNIAYLQFILYEKQQF